MRIQRFAKIIAIVLLAICCPLRSDAGDLTLAWDSPSDGVTVGYIVSYGEASQSYSWQEDVGYITSYAVNGLSDGSTYYFAVRAYSATGAFGDWSNEISATVTPSVPPVVTALALTSSVPPPQVAGTAVNWLATAAGGVAPYEFEWALYGAGSWTVWPWTAASTWTWTPSTPGSDYQVKVAVRSSGSSSSSGEMAVSVPFAVIGRSPTLTWGNPPGIVYGTALGPPQLNATADVPGTFAYGPPAGTVLGAGTQALTVNFTPTDTVGYTTASMTVSLNVLKAGLTIKADGKTKVFGAPLPVFTATPTGLVNGDTMASLSGTAVFTTVATATSQVGTYAITPGGVSSPNYVTSFVNGTLTIAKAATSNSLESSRNPSRPNQRTTLKSTVRIDAPGAGVPTGIVDFLDGSTLLGSGSVTNSGGILSASLTLNGLPPGTHVLTARYRGDGSFAASTSPAVSQVVQK